MVIAPSTFVRKIAWPTPFTKSTVGPCSFKARAARLTDGWSGSACRGQDQRSGVPATGGKCKVRESHSSKWVGRFRFRRADPRSFFGFPNFAILAALFIGSPVDSLENPCGLRDLRDYRMPRLFYLQQSLHPIQSCRTFTAASHGETRYKKKTRQEISCLAIASVNGPPIRRDVGASASAIQLLSCSRMLARGPSELPAPCRIHHC